MSWKRGIIFILATIAVMLGMAAVAEPMVRLLLNRLRRRGISIRRTFEVQIGPCR